MPYGDLSAMGEALEDMMTKPDAAAAAFRQTLARERFQFAPYVTKLLALAAPDLPRISVAVPNYNYARYMPERLGGIFAQTHPVHEVLMLDDCSKDDSLTVIPAIAADWGTRHHAHRQCNEFRLGIRAMATCGGNRVGRVALDCGSRRQFAARLSDQGDGLYRQRPPRRARLFRQQHDQLRWLSPMGEL